MENGSGLLHPLNRRKIYLDKVARFGGTLPRSSSRSSIAGRGLNSAGFRLRARKVGKVRGRNARPRVHPLLQQQQLHLVRCPHLVRIVIGTSFSMRPAGVAVVVRSPLATTLSIVCDPSCSADTSDCCGKSSFLFAPGTTPIGSFIFATVATFGPFVPALHMVRSCARPGQ